MSALKRAFGKLLEPLLRRVRIERVDQVAPRFRRFELSGEALRGARVNAGDKLQVLLDGELRTYSPFGFDASAGRLSLLAFDHGDGPGAHWSREALAGDELRVFGPRSSLPFETLPTPVLLVGDETSLGVARALTELHPASQVVLEAHDVDATRSAANAIGLGEPSVVARAPGDGHLEALWEAIQGRGEPRATLVLTGRAQTIRAVLDFARRDGVGFAARKSKAYWAPGKRGLD